MSGLYVGGTGSKLSMLLNKHVDEFQLGATFLIGQAAETHCEWDLNPDPLFSERLVTTY